MMLTFLVLCFSVEMISCDSATSSEASDEEHEFDWTGIEMWRKEHLNQSVVGDYDYTTRRRAPDIKHLENGVPIVVNSTGI